MRWLWDPQEPRLRRRQRLTLWSVLPAIVLVVLAVRLLLLPVQMGQAQDAHQGDDGAGVIDAGESLGVMNLVERWRAPFVEGTGRSMNGDLAGGRSLLETALERTGNEQDDCTVRTNLVLNISAQADVAAEQGDTDTEQRLAQEALTLIEEGPEGCLDGSDDGNDGEAGRQQREEQEKLQEQTGQGEEEDDQDGQDGDEGEDGDEEQDQQGEGEEETDPQQEELQERNQQGQGTSEQERRQRQGDGGQDTVEKPW
ncbi:hypothetical protein GCM10027055_29040 [Janibacter alkaliphilus]|uniref:Uncharacterized protein n=1 Tax=Janibacter alkaliphilus TaxID=1069963 RepID=A0A852X070_9MICO|nr:hypothetical protein [Janibacter alkaliphilus]NYG36516.1 hypothetical protein [Janibacter alkaliphilus]